MSVKVLNLTAAGLIQTIASTTTTAGINVPHGAAPTTPVNGDVWTTTTGMYVRVNGATVGPLGAGGGTPATTVTTLTGLQSAVVGTSTNYSREDHQHAVANVVDTTSAQTAIAGAKTFTGTMTVDDMRSVAVLMGVY